MTKRPQRTQTDTDCHRNKRRTTLSHSKLCLVTAITSLALQKAIIYQITIKNKKRILCVGCISVVGKHRSWAYNFAFADTEALRRVAIPQYITRARTAVPPQCIIPIIYYTSPTTSSETQLIAGNHATYALRHSRPVRPRLSGHLSIQME